MELSRLAVPSVYGLILFLGYPSQWLLLHLEPWPLSKNQLIHTNLVLVCIFITYTKTVFVDPGTFPRKKDDGEELSVGNGCGKEKARKWCRKCNAAKPPRAHHCKECKRCIPKMDHHCPWTGNCVSYTTFPHFMRFLFFTVWGMSLLASFLWTRLAHLWANRDLPSYLGPSKLHLTHLFVVTVVNSITFFALSVLLIRNIWCLAVNTTTIEGWEIERHRTLLRRARHFGGYLEGPDGIQMRIKKQEFPYDIGIWKNIKQGMGTGNILAWFNPLSGTPPIESALSFETNDFEDASTTWPPPDPDRLHRRFPKSMARAQEAFTYRDAGLTRDETLAAFKQRQDADVTRRRTPFVERLEAQVARERRSEEEKDDYDHYEDSEGEADELDDSEAKKENGSQSGEEGWRNAEGERLKDFGVDEDVEFYDEQEDDMPLSQLLARKRAASASASASASAPSPPTSY
ncbi:DHHC palmitoyltransferase-domain-containing protein [Massariosphaeria phaeospora]|uniref:Palmitoyltransferase PFA4 n=1 Tax=Massariosphaeria phaeospora TaxID=100035 RepID=A0A7C8M759_9PLEO|nr:DHHC palmitoyltransferase-domain-containing protein [Massariosphaeria phaeospora]